MTRKSLRMDSHAQSLFPFLAVLLCAVGSLIVILVLAVYYAQSSARREVESAQLELETVSDEVEFVSKETEARRVKQTEALLASQGRLAHYEDHIERLEAELTQLQRQLELAQSSSEGESIEWQRGKLTSLQEELAEAEQALREKVESVKNRPPAYAILPYHGTSGTLRRPIYLECTREGVILQPEGILIRVEELGPPYGPGNPLDAVLRLMGSEFEKASIATSQLSAPYPLLLVRPDGIKTYALARNAMGGWDDQFGYELIGQDLPLAFPEGLPGMVSKIEKAVAVARERQSALLAAMPANYRRAPMENGLDGSSRTPNNEWSTANSRPRETTPWQMLEEQLPAEGQTASWGDDDRVVGSDGTSQRPGYGAGSHSGVAGARYPGAGGSFRPSPGNLGSGGLGGGVAGSNSGMSSGGPGSGLGSQTELGRQGGNGSSGNGGVSGGMNGGAGGSGTGGNMAGPTFGGAMSNGAGGNASGSSMAGLSGSPQNLSELDAYDREQNPLAGMNGSGIVANEEGSASASGSSMDNTSGTRTGTGEGSASRSTATGNGMRKNTSGQGSDPGGSEGAEFQRSVMSDDRPISISMGQNWASSREAGRTTPITRDIHMQVLPDRWLLLNENNLNTIDVSIDIASGPQVAGKLLAKSIRERVTSWGIAVARGYWKPRLNLYPTRGSELSLQRLQRLLEGSGVDLQIHNTPIPSR